nr:uncharacterized protein LOC109167102 [Ipomoea batatas]
MVRTLSMSSDFAVDPRRDVGKAADSEIGVPSSRRDFRSSLPVAPNPNLPGREEGAVISDLDNYYFQQNQHQAEVELKMVTEDGVPIDFTALERGGDDAFTEELNRRTAGMETRDQLFRFIEGLGGEWLNRKRMCVDAGEFVDVLPAGWKVTVAIKPSRQGRSVPYFYRYISPSGEQFPSCKEVARFLQTQFLSRPTAQNVAVLPGEDDGDGVNCTAVVPDIALEMHGEEILPEGTDNQAGGVQIHDRYYCEFCKIGFNERTEFARHRRFHRKTRSGGYRNRPPLTDGMIMKDGKYGCQFCPKVFDRLTSYTGHVGIHLRRNLKFSSTAIEAAPMAAHTYYGKDPRGARVRLRPRAYSRVSNLRFLSEILMRDEEEELANLRLLSEVSERWFNERMEFARHRKFHRKTRSGGYRNRPPLTDGMIMKDGKYGCQFCPKVFDRLTSYTGHVGIHLRRNLKCSSTSIEAAPMAANTYYGKDPRGARVRLRPRAYSRVDNLRLLSEISMRDEEEELANLRLLSEVSGRLI